jgi:hypothetical protein
LAGCGLAALARRKAALGVLAGTALLAVMLPVLPAYYQARRPDGLRELVAAVWREQRPGDAVILVSGDRYPMFGYCYDHPLGPRWRAELFELPDRGPGRFDASLADQKLAPLAARYRRLWLAWVDGHFQDPGGHVPAWLEEQLVREWQADFPPSG